MIYYVFVFFFFFFFKQKTAYEISVRDWSSDVCSSDLSHSLVGHVHHLDSGEQLEQLGRDVVDRSVARRGVGKLPGIPLGVGDELGIGGRRDRWMHREEGRQRRDRGDAREILERPV